MAKSLRHRRLSLDDTLGSGLSLIAVTSSIVLITYIFIRLAFHFQTTADYFVCSSGETIPSSYVHDGMMDCISGSDEAGGAYEEIQEGDKEFGMVSYVMLGVGLIVSLSGIFGIITKIMADSISAGLMLHAQNNTHDSEVHPPAETPSPVLPSGPPSTPPSEDSKYTEVDRAPSSSESEARE
ncbi:MAG: hypothetical protein CMB69_00565 [Euryarchaeota archaeon]|nr:hypothetical protein [Euryarchaeota archaeon]